MTSASSICPLLSRAVCSFRCSISASCHPSGDVGLWPGSISTAWGYRGDAMMIGNVAGDRPFASSICTHFQPSLAIGRPHPAGEPLGLPVLLCPEQIVESRIPAVMARSGVKIAVSHRTATPNGLSEQKEKQDCCVPHVHLELKRSLQQGQGPTLTCYRGN